MSSSWDFFVCFLTSLGVTDCTKRQSTGQGYTSELTYPLLCLSHYDLDKNIYGHKEKEV